MIRSAELDVDFTTTGSVEASEAVLGEEFEAMHKTWGAGGDITKNGGVHKDNIFIAERVWGGQPARPVLVLQAQGDLATDGSPALSKGASTNGGTDFCSLYDEAPGTFKRVGAVAATKDMFASGTYEASSATSRVVLNTGTQPTRDVARRRSPHE